MADENGALPEIAISTGADPLVEIDRIVKNTRQDVLVITTSNAEVVLTRAWKRIQQSNDWLAPLALLISIVMGLLTTDFVGGFGLSAEAWKAVFVVGAVASAGWLAVMLFRLSRTGGVLSPQKVVELLMADGTLLPAAAPSVPGLPPVSAAPRMPTPTPPRIVPRNGNGDAAAQPEESPSAAQLFSGAGTATPSVPEPRHHAPPSTSGPVATAAAVATGAPPANGVANGALASTFSPGTHVRHRNFGTGTVVELVPGSPRFLRVRFDDPDVGTKKLREDLASLWLRGDEQ
ncbi:MAG TPA: hypothetical protein VGI84_05815 [Pseudonocardiaceae bacterium]